MTDFSLFDEKHQSYASVSKSGELITRPYAYSDPYFASITATSVGTEVVPGKAQHYFVITSFWVVASKTVSPSTPADVVLYEAHPADLDTNLSTILQREMVRKDEFNSPSGLNLRVEEGRTIAATTTDPTIDITILGFYLPKVNGD